MEIQQKTLKDKLGYIEGLMWIGLLGWRSTGVDISKMKRRVRVISQRISERKWEKD